MRSIAAAALCCAVAISNVHASGESLEFTLQTNLYSSLQQVPCTRLMTAREGSIGCGSVVEGSGGVFFLLEDEADYTAFFDTDESLDTVIVAQPHLFTANRLNRMRKHGSIQGAILLPSSGSSAAQAGYSPLASEQLSLTAGQGGDLTADDSGVQYITTAWNKLGSGLGLQYFGSLPMSAVAGAQAAAVLSQARENKKRGPGKYPAYAARFWSPMGPADLNSVDCLVEGTCDYMGGQSVWASSTPLWKNFTADATEPAKRQFVMAATTGDAFAQFHERAFGADAAVSGTVALIAAASALGQGHLAGRWNLTRLQYGMLWGVFQGEHVGRLGSRQWVEDIANFRCNARNRRWGEGSPSGKPLCASPVRTDLAFRAINQTSDIVHALAVQQVGSPRTPDQTSPPYTPPHMGLYQGGLAASSVARSSEGQYLRDVLQLVAAADSTPFSVASEAASPPSPLDAVRASSADVNAALLMRANGSSYNNAFYGSSMDNSDNIDAAAVTEAATFVARSMFALASGEATAAAAAAAVPFGLSVDAALVQELISCFTVNAQCDLFAAAVGRSKASLPEGPLSLFTGLFQRPSVGATRIVVPTSLAEAVIKNILGNATVSEVNGTCSSSSQCQDATGSTRFECLFGRCVVTNSYLHSAKSLGVSDQLRIFASRADALDPMYTEPLWSTGLGAQLYVVDSPVSGIVMLSLGLIMTLGACFGVRRFSSWVTQHYKVL